MTEETSTAETDAGDEWAEAMSEQSEAESAATDANSALPEAPLQNLQADNTGNNEPSNLEAILDIPVSLSVQIGQTKISIKNLLQLNQAR